MVKKSITELSHTNNVTIQATGIQKIEKDLEKGDFIVSENLPQQPELIAASSSPTRRQA